ncbi:UNVERIFIED_CONTAM: hypothetical protein Sangu_0402700 [Sesamum angustifolium]|uniref:Uncharacterized protein n=1 Tax=Sesamum angustifolium TaxID=2727405 RepID=A0AAW2QSN8_9LAMI
MTFDEPLNIINDVSPLLLRIECWVYAIQHLLGCFLAADKDSSLNDAGSGGVENLDPKRNPNAAQHDP